jgi:hypothetical protein
MSAKRVLLRAFPLPLLAIAGIILVVVSPFHTEGKAGSANTANTSSCDDARQHLREADKCLAAALDGLRRVGAANDRVVFGDRRLIPRYIKEITEFRARLNQLSQDADGRLRGLMLPEIDQANDF